MNPHTTTTTATTTTTTSVSTQDAAAAGTAEVFYHRGSVTVRDRVKMLRRVGAEIDDNVIRIRTLWQRLRNAKVSDGPQIDASNIDDVIQAKRDLAVIINSLKSAIRTMPVRDMKNDVLQMYLEPLAAAHQELENMYTHHGLASKAAKQKRLVKQLMSPTLKLDTLVEYVLQ